jgi:DNA-binding XRE family transcriptional regulator
MKKLDDVYIRMGQRIRHLRQMALMSQDDLAKKVGLQRTSVVNIEAGKQRVMLHDIATIAGIFKLSPERFINSIITDE